MKLFPCIFLVFVASSVVYGQSSKEGRRSAGCELTIAQSPVLRGFWLGMSQEQVESRLPYSYPEYLGRPSELRKVQYTVVPYPDYDHIPFGSKKLYKGVSDDPNRTNADKAFLVSKTKISDLEGVTRITLRLIGNRVSYLNFEYDDSVQWSNVAELVRAVADKLALPSEWQDSGSNSSSTGKILKCNGFQITAQLVLGSDLSLLLRPIESTDGGDSKYTAQLILEDLTENQMIEKYRKEEENRKRLQAEEKRLEEEKKRKGFKP